MVVVSMLPYAEIGQNDHRVGAPHFRIFHRGVFSYNNESMLSDRWVNFRINMIYKIIIYLNVKFELSFTKDVFTIFI